VAVLLGGRRLSSFLDNAPTYVAFLALGQGLGLPGEVVGVPHAILVAISVGAVPMGANTYIGNAPNFMVKAIAETAGGACRASSATRSTAARC
jgi:Na+/H+ antiporter NhaD/arsenite permease-like protein